LGQAWEGAEGDELDDTALAGRVEAWGLDNIPAECLAMTAGIDVQADRVEVATVGWSRDGTAYILAHQVLWGTTDSNDGEVWRELDHLLKMKHPHPSGGALKIDAACVDAGDGGMMDVVTAFCAPRLSRRVFAIKGVSGFARASIQRAKTKGKPLFIVGSDGIKARLFDRLAKGRSIRFSNTLPPEFFEQLTSEKRITKLVRGKPTMRFERKPGFDAEALDCVVYATAAKAALHLNFDLRSDELRNAPPPPPPTIIRSEWMSR